jgi:hypothetical protein
MTLMTLCLMKMSANRWWARREREKFPKIYHLKQFNIFLLSEYSLKTSEIEMSEEKSKKTQNLLLLPIKSKTMVQVTLQFPFLFPFLVVCFKIISKSRVGGKEMEASY